jgi:hypothetical protein
MATTGEADFPEKATAYAAILASKPLLGFAPSCQFQLEALARAAAAINRELDDSIQPDAEGKTAVVKSATDINQSRGDFWLWVLGAYELIRTLKQHRRAFSTAAVQRFLDMHDRLLHLRIPFAKLEFARTEAQPIAQEAIVCDSIDIKSKDYVYLIRGRRYAIRGLIDEFENCMSQLRIEDVLSPRSGDEMAQVIRYLATHGAPG